LIDLAILSNMCDIDYIIPRSIPDDSLAGSASFYCGYYYNIILLKYNKFRDGKICEAWLIQDRMEIQER